MKKVFKVSTVLLIIATLISAFCYYEFGGLWLKALTSSGFVLTGLVNLTFAFSTHVDNKKFPILMCIGLFLSLAGDIVINIEFIPGALVFALGHIFYFLAYSSWMKFGAKDLIPIAAVFTVAFLILTLYPGFDFDAIIFAICVFYALIISFMLGKTFANAIRKKCALNTILVIGSVLFFVSDLALVLHMFGGVGKIADTICLATYFPAQCFLAYGIYRYVKDINNNNKISS